ncbi:MAG: HDOD domain-containing protein [Nitrospirae bacterium]|nr:HDOD domain-containing protein [Nitrospirota bacterium]
MARRDDIDLINQSKKIIKTVSIPPQPKIVMEIKSELGMADPDFDRIARLVCGDTSLCAMILKVAHSPMFGADRFHSVDKAIERVLASLGADTFYNILVDTSLRRRAGTHKLDGFYSHSEVVAKSCAYLANKTGLVSSDIAYMAGLFHDCGVPVLVEKFDNYIGIAEIAMGLVPAKSLSGEQKSIIGIEGDMFKTDHCVVGYLFARLWGLSKSVSDVILYHHYVDIDIHKDKTTKDLAAMLLLSEFLCLFYDNVDNDAYRDIEQWAAFNNKVVVHLNIDSQDIIDMKDDVMEF